jgi:hypothetical protein
MADEAKDILKQALGKEEKPLNEQEKQVHRNAAAFALSTFSESFRKNVNTTYSGRVNLTEEQIKFAENLANVFPKPEDILPKSEFNSAMKGYLELVATPVFEIIPASLTNSVVNFGKQRMDARRYLEKDPSGVLYLQKVLMEMEEKARHGKNIGIEKKEDEFKNKMKEMTDESENYSDEISPEKLPENLSIEEGIAKISVNALSGGKISPRSKFIQEKRYEIHNEIPLEMEEEAGKPLATDKLKAMGAGFAFDQYQKAVNIYLNRWGKT